MIEWQPSSVRRFGNHPNFLGFGYSLICRCLRCRDWRRRVQDIREAERAWEPNTAAALRANSAVFDALVG